MLLIGAGIDELSVSPARLDAVRGIVRSVSFVEARAAVQKALGAESTADAVEIAAELLHSHGANGLSQADNGLHGVVA